MFLFLLINLLACNSKKEPPAKEPLDKVVISVIDSTEFSTSQHQVDSNTIDTKIHQGSEIKYGDFSCCGDVNFKLLTHVEQKIGNLTNHDILEFLSNLRVCCSGNVEFQEYSNELLYRALETQPEIVVQSLSSKEFSNNLDYILELISSPLLDYNFDQIANSVAQSNGEEKIKAKIMRALERAKEG